MKNFKNKLFLATAILALASCADNTYLGDEEINNQGNGGKIIFGSSTPSLTRAEGATAAGELGYSFAVYATKTVSSTTSNVFAQNTYSATPNVPYWVWYQASTANNTTSNSADWEYVGTGGSVITPAITAQTIKYWDESASQYDFVAYKAKPVGTEPAAASITNLTTTGFTAQGTIEQLAALYIADKKVVTSGDYGKEVKFTFRKAASKVRLGIYETIPGYDVKNIKFKYNSTEDNDEAYLTGSFIYYNSAATFDVTYSGTPLKAVLTPASGTSYNATYFNFGSFDSSTQIGETSTAPTWTNTISTNYYKDVLPNTSNVGAMTLTIDYTLINTVSGETINITGATATVPAAYMTWNPNFAYTYLFKITDDKLTPITFDAVTIDDGEGNQQTITTVDNPSITTYQKGAIVNEYNAGNIFVVVGDGTALTPGANANLYTASAQDGYTGGITEASVANALKNGTKDDSTTPTTWTVTDASSKTLTVSSADGLTTFTEIPNTDSPTGVALTINGAKFTATAGTTYVFEYIPLVQATGTYVAGTTYYTDNTGATTVGTTSFVEGVTDVSSYFVAQPAEKHYKVIKVAAATPAP
jgi:hypothetical protein